MDSNSSDDNSSCKDAAKLMKPAKERGYYTYPELFMVSQKRKG
jgi:hypothetical protein